MNIIRHCIICLAILGISALISAQDIEIFTPDSNEVNLDGAVLDLTLITCNFIREGDIDPGAVILYNAPDSLRVASVTSTSGGSSGTAVLEFNPGDFDVNYLYFYIGIHDSVLNVGFEAESDSIELEANIESADITSNPSPLSENAMNYIEVFLTDEYFIHYDTLKPSDFTLVNFPDGVSISNIDIPHSDNNDARLELSFLPGDFDTDSLHCKVAIAGNVLTYSSDSLGSDELTIEAVVETATFNAGDSRNLRENDLDAGRVVLDLGDDTFTGTGDLGAANFELVNFPAGTSIESVDATDDDRVEIELDFAYTDFDTDSANCQIGINPNILTLNKPNFLYSNTFTVSRYIETPEAFLTPDQAFQEHDLDGRYIDVLLSEEYIDPLETLNSDDITLVSAPYGLTVNSISVTDSIHFRVNLEDTITVTDADFDTDLQMRISIDESKLIQSRGVADLVSESVVVSHYIETPGADITPGGWLREWWLDGLSVDLKFTEEKFKFGVPVTRDHFRINNGPPGLGIEDIRNKADSSVTIDLSFDNTDFDTDFNNVEIAIAESILLQTETDSLYSSDFVVIPNIEPVVSSVDIPNQNVKVGDTVDVFFYLDVPGIDQDTVFELTSGDIGGYPLFGLEKKADDEYWSKFTVTENQNDFYALEDIPVNNLRLDDSPLTGETFNGFITGNDNDRIDSRIPVVSSLSIIGVGDKKIGDDVILLISSLEAGLFLEDSSSINSIPVTDPDITFDAIGGASYTVTYTIQGNDPNVAPGALEAKIHLRDTAGNVNRTYPTILPNSLSIDATAPLITSVTETSANDTAIIGSTVTLTIVTDGTDYVLGDQSHVNGVPYTELGLTHQGGGIYEISYTVQEGDAAVTAGNLTASIELQDVAGNKSPPATSILNNDIAIFTERPTARLTGFDEVCLNDTATLFITLTGPAPWTIRYTDAANSYYIYDVYSTDYTLKIKPDSTQIYTIEEVTDGTGNTNTGTGTSLVTVNPLPSVEILNLDPVYAIDVAKFTLQGSPAGGTFTGPGVITAEQTFTPAVAGLTLDSPPTPHRIIYEYYDGNQCYSADTSEVFVVEAEVTWYYPDVEEFACYLDTGYTLSAVNTSGGIGQFSVPEVSNPGFMVDHGDNTVTLYPGVIDWPVGSSNRQYKVVYKYDRQGVEVTEDITLDIEYFDTTRITGMTETVFCSNEDPIEVFGNKDEGVYTGPGISNPIGFNYEFDPGAANLGRNTLYYTYISPMNCLQVDSVEILINPTPVSDFVLLDTCIFKRPVGDTIHFLNSTDNSGLGSLIWEWEFGHIASGEDNLSNLKNPTHWYSDPGSWTIELTATTVNGCANTFIKSFIFGDKPTAKLSWDTECFTNDPIVFSAAETEHTDLIDKYQWIIADLSGNEVLNTTLGGTQETLSHSFLAMENYRVELRVESELQCRDDDVDTIYLRPYFENLAADSDYLENFEDLAVGWIAESDENSILQSWELNMVEAANFPYESIDGTKAWFTDLTRKDTIEQSWVSSPCFDFSKLRKPMIKLNVKVSSDRDRDGTALQYTTNDGETWNNVGAIDDGSINWYNTFRILSGPGGQGEGWTGDFVFSENPQWVKAMHELDDLSGESRVQFRVAYGSDGTSLENNEGFAFDNIWIGERSRVVLLEHFTNSGDGTSKDANSLVNSLVSNNSLDAIDIQYHAEVSGLSDKMNEDNPAPASARALFYGTRDVPYTVLDGGGTEGAWIYDFVETQLDTLDLYTRVLQDPGFDIAITTTASGGSMVISIELEALDTLPNREYILYTAIVEKEITNASYEGANGETVFQNVARDMLPNAAGMSFIRGWNPGDKEDASFNWTIDYVLDDEMIYVVAFVQDAASKIVYQATSNDPDLWATSVGEVMAARNLSMMVYPNPANDRAYVMFEEIQSDPIELQLFNQLGSMVMNVRIESGTELHEFDVSRLPKGIYFVRAIQKGQYKDISKLVIMH